MVWVLVSSRLPQGGASARRDLPYRSSPKGDSRMILRKPSLCVGCKRLWRALAQALAQAPASAQHPNTHCSLGVTWPCTGLKEDTARPAGPLGKAQGATALELCLPQSL